MPPLPATLEKAAPKIIDITLNAPQNVLTSMMLLTKDEDEPGIHGWIGKTRNAMSKKERENHSLAMIGFFFALHSEDGNITFPAYLNNLERIDPVELRDKMLKAYSKLLKADNEEVNWDEVLVSSQTYIDFLLTRFTGEQVMVEIETRAYEYVIDPPAMKNFLVKHMTLMWEKYFKAEWDRVQPMLLESIRSFMVTDFNKMTRTDAASFIIGQDVSNAKWCQYIDEVDRAEFIPNPHIGPYVHASGKTGVARIIFGARQPEGAPDRIPELDRTEIVSRLSALADETRLHILQLATERDEIRVQDILEVINLSQPSVSRYLTQLSAAGFLQERREGGAKVYSLNKERVDRTLKAVSAFLLGR